MSEGLETVETARCACSEELKEDEQSDRYSETRIGEGRLTQEAGGKERAEREREKE